MPDWSERNIASPLIQSVKREKKKKRNGSAGRRASFTAPRNGARKQKGLQHDGGGPSSCFKRQFLAERSRNAEAGLQTSVI